jgi:hypothetical protein
MELFGKAFGDVSINDIQEIVHNEIPESRALDYKLELHPATDAGNKEFLKDISAFANTVGGYLIYGVNEEGGIPVDIKGVEIDDFDKMKLRFENLLRTGVHPAIRGVDFVAVDLKEATKVVVIKVPKSIARPHVVKIKDHFRFYGRNSGGVYMLEVDDLRRAFLASETLGTTIRNFRSDRLAQIATGEGHIPLEKGAKTVLHLIPVSAFELGMKYDLDSISDSDIKPIYNVGWSNRVNFDGLVSFFDDRERGTVWSYAQLFRNGIIEAVDVKLLSPHDDKKEIPSVYFERKIVCALENYIYVLGKLGVDLPIWVALSLLGVKGYQMVGTPDLLRYRTYPIDRDELIIPEVQVEQEQVSGERILKPAFDAIWNACGYERSFNYDENGNWRVRTS